ncbi:putative Cytochrome P450 [Quillaja saponaria]|uniref:Cytochrome P450 n=1 Tax=Quillaja saponaria TaxID=32244 RepID=A0AAD7PJF9_QUISA|nr:putative Cytochrome P450 [Quillaja saponaria]
MSLKLGQITTVVISSAAIAKEVLQTQDLAFSNRTIPDSTKAHNHDQLGIPWLSISSSRWRNLRKFCNSNLFTAKKLDANFHLRRRKVQDLIDEVEASCEAGVEVDIGQVAFRTTLNFLSNTVFSVDLADPNSKFTKDFKEIVWRVMELVVMPNLADYFPLLRVIDPQRIRLRMGYCFSQIFAFLDDIINQRLKLSRMTGYVPSGDMLDVLLKIIETNNEDIDRPQMDHQLLDLFVVGTDSTTSRLEFAMAELLHNRETLSKAQAELGKTIGKVNLVEESDIARLPYLQAIVKETLRLHPAAPFLLPRKVEKNTELCGFTIPGAQVLVNAWAIGRDPSMW